MEGGGAFFFGEERFADEEEPARSPAVEEAGMEDAGFDDLEVDFAGAVDGLRFLAGGGDAGGVFGEGGIFVPSRAPEFECAAAGFAPAGDPGEGFVAKGAVGEGGEVREQFLLEVGGELDFQGGGFFVDQIGKGDRVPAAYRRGIRLR